MILFKVVRYKNFFSTGNTFTEVILNAHHTTLIVGNSGSGKSTVEDAIAFGLYGKPFRPVNKAQVINTINNKECVVEIEFETAGKSYKIIRGLKPTKFEIYCNDKLINPDSSSSDYQDYLEQNILKMNFKVFSRIVVLGIVNFVPFMQLTSQNRRELVEDLLDIKIFSKMSALLKERISANKNEILENNSLIATQEEKIRIFEKYLEELKQDKQRQIDDNLEKIKKLDNDIVNYQDNIDKFKNPISLLIEQIKDEKKILNKLQKYKNFQRDIQNNISKLNKEIQFYDKNKECPTCHREFNSEYVESMTKEGKVKLNELNEGFKKILPLIKETTEKYNEIQKVSNQIVEIKSKISTIEVKLLSCKEYKNKLLRDNASIKSNQQKNSKNLNEIHELNNELKTFKDKKEKILQHKMILEFAGSILKDGGVKTQIIKQYLPVINKLINRFLSCMNFFVTFSIDENFDEIIKKRGRDNLTYASLSEGERQRLDIAILLTWRTIATTKNSVRTNLLFMDELLDSSLDLNAAENVMELLKNEPILKDNNIFVISHKTTLIDKFSNILKFEDINNFSKCTN